MALQYILIPFTSVYDLRSRSTMELETVSLGSREIDENFPYERARKKYTQKRKKYIQFVANAKDGFKQKTFPHWLLTKTPTPDQKHATQIVFEMINAYKKGQKTLFILEGEGGSGKSQCFHQFCALLKQQNMSYDVVSPTAVNTTSIGATTLHGYLGWYLIKKRYEDLVDESIFPSVRARIKQTQFLLLDEIGMVGAAFFWAVIMRIWKVKSKNPPTALSINNLPVSIIAAGDFRQLGCISDRNLKTPISDSFAPNIKTSLQIFAQAHYRFELQTNIRQNNDPIYQRILKHIREEKFDDEDLHALETRLEQNVDDSELERFFPAVHIFSTNFQCELWHKFFLSQQNIPIKLIQPQSSISCAVCTKEYRPCYLGKGVNVFVTRNLFTAAGLCNGVESVVEDIYYPKGKNKPIFVTIKKPEGYSGAVLDEDGTIPIGFQKDFLYCMHKKKKFFVEYIPLSNSQAITIWKAQGRTINPLVACFDGFRLNDNRSVYTSLSRCGSLSNLIIKSQLPLKEYFSRTQNVSNSI